MSHTGPAEGAVTTRMRRPQRREQILAAATVAFARAGFAATSLDDIASQAEISQAILYRHFDSKADLYRAALERTCSRLAAEVGTDTFTDIAIDTLLRAASADPDGFQLLFRHAIKEPEFQDLTESIATVATDVARRHLQGQIPQRQWASWAAQLVPIVTIEAVLAWLDAGQPQPESAAERVRQLVVSVVDAASADGPERKRR